jgi:glucokinase
MNPAVHCMGVSVSYSKVQAVICDAYGNVIASLSRRITRDEDPVPESIGLLDKLMTKDVRNSIISLGISFPGIISEDKLSVINSVYFSEFHTRPLAEEFEVALQIDIPVKIERNAVCELTGMVVSRKIRDDTLLISFNSGITAAILTDGRILEGQTGNLAKLGHFPDTKSKVPCLCGKKGCIDTVTGEVAWIRDFRRISKLPGSQDSFYDAMESGMPQAVKMLRYGLDAIFPVLDPLLMLFDPENLIFSADLPPSSGLVFATLMEQKNNENLSNILFADTLCASRGAAILGFLNICRSDV